MLEGLHGAGAQRVIAQNYAESSLPTTRGRRWGSGVKVGVGGEGGGRGSIIDCDPNHLARPDY